ncbi:hypothetical protein [Sphingomonas melonis]|uniref:Uncharacterized protein n=1 Tax=Sphingomonas melonis TaxID=152682 RepID=A0A7Y9FR85_9SPHN|nr:hypothetical protein [Sphingomonas melonis]NYD91979.1 hypothetical protein [Sphingomonas melonis]
MARSRLRPAWLAAAGVTLVLSGMAIGSERRVAAVAAARDAEPPARAALLAEATGWRPADVPPRAAIGLAALWLRQAGEAVQPGADRASLAHARAMLAIADDGRPTAAATLLLHSQLALTPGDHPGPASLRAFTASYAAAPFLTAEGFWRAAYAARYWRDLPAATQEAAVAEAAWLAALDGRFNDRLVDIMGGSPMSVRFALRMPPKH